MNGEMPGRDTLEFKDKRARSLATIYELTTELLDVEDITALLRRIGESIRGLFGFTRISISVADDVEGIFTDHVLIGYSPEEEAEVWRNSGSFKQDVILADLRDDCKISRIAYYIPVEIHSSSADAFVAVRNLEAASRPRADDSSWHELDLLYFLLHDRKGKILGYLQVDYPLDGKIPSREIIEEIELFAGVAAVGIENSRMFQRTKSLLEENEVKTQRILRILELTRSVLRIDDMDAVLQKVSDAMSFVFGFRKTGVSLFSEGSDKVTVHAMTGYNPDEAEVIKRAVILKSIVLEDFKEEFRVTETGYFIPAESQPKGPNGFIFLESPENAKQSRGSPESWHELDLLYFGLCDRNGQLIGYVQLDYPSDGKIPTRETMEAMEAFSSLASIAIENSALYEEVDDARTQVRTYLDLLTHDVGNLVNPLNAYIELLLATTTLDVTQHKYLNSALEGTRSIQHLIRNVRRMAQTVEGMKLESVPVNVSTSLRRVAADAKNAFVGRDVDIRLSLPPEDLWVMADTLVDEVFYNLISNAIKYDGHDKVVIDVEAKQTEFEGLLCVSFRFVDRGQGIPDEYKEKVFQRGFRESSRAEWASAPKTRGAGMGLPLVKALVARYNGKIWIENRVYGDFTKGSVLNVLLPSA